VSTLFNLSVSKINTVQCAIKLSLVLKNVYSICGKLIYFCLIMLKPVATCVATTPIIVKCTSPQFSTRHTHPRLLSFQMMFKLIKLNEMSVAVACDISNCHIKYVHVHIQWTSCHQHQCPQHTDPLG